MKSMYVVFFISAILCINIKAQDTQGFFLDDWEPRSITSPSYTDTVQAIGATPTVITIDYTDTIARVSKYVYGNNANPYSGIMNKDNTLLKYINDLNPHILRWPGGNLSQEYFWNRSTRPSDIPDDAGFWAGNPTWGQSNDDFYELLQKTHSTGSICVNVAYARYGTSENPVQKAAGYAADWVRYDNGRSKFWELGNENFGSWEAGYSIDTTLNADGQPEIISGDLYGEICSVFIDSMRAAAAEIDVDIKIGAVAMEQLVTYDPVQMHWNSGMMPHLADKADFYIVHSYYTPFEENSTVETILNSPSHTKEFVNYINSGLADVGHEPMPIALTEWNIFATGSMQMVSYINGMHGAINLGELIKQKYGMAARWDLSNGWGEIGDDHGMFAASDEPDVPFRTPHPQFHYMYYFQKCFGDRMVNTVVKGNNKIVTYASSFASGHCGVVLTNKSRYGQKVELDVNNFQTGKHFYIYTLTGGKDNGDFSRKVYINGQGPDIVAGGPSNYDEIKPYGLTGDDRIKLSMPPLSVVYVVIDPVSIPDIEWAKIMDDPDVVKVKLTREVVIPDPFTGFNVTLNDSENDSIINIEKDINDSTILLLTLNKTVANTDNIILSYSGGEFMTTDSLALLDNPKINVENLLSGSSPIILDALTDSAGTAIYIRFNKNMEPATADLFGLNISYLDDHDVVLSDLSYYDSDSGIYHMSVAEPLYFDYQIRLSSLGTGILSTDGGELMSFDSLPVRNFSPFKPPTVQQAYTSVQGDSIILVFDKDLLFNTGLKTNFSISLDGSDIEVRAVTLGSGDARNLIILPQGYITHNIENIFVSYTGEILFAYDSAGVESFNDLAVENLSARTDVEMLTAPAFSIYPNPAKNEFTIHSDFRYTKIEIFDLTGRQVYIEYDNSGFPDTKVVSLQLSKGIYLIVLKGKDHEMSDKIVIE